MGHGLATHEHEHEHTHRNICTCIYWLRRGNVKCRATFERSRAIRRAFRHSMRLHIHHAARNDMQNDAERSDAKGVKGMESLPCNNFAFWAQNRIRTFYSFTY